MAHELGRRVQVRSLTAKDRAEVERIDRGHRGSAEPAYWRSVFDRFRGGAPGVVGLGAAAGGGRLQGFLLGEVRGFEFGSEICGWVFAVGVDPSARRSGVGAALLQAAVHAFAALGVVAVRTMVARGDVPLQAFFRSAGFVGGPFVQLELTLAEAGAAP